MRILKHKKNLLIFLLGNKKNVLINTYIGILKYKIIIHVQNARISAMLSRINVYNKLIKMLLDDKTNKIEFLNIMFL